MTGILQNYLPLVVFIGVAGLIGLALLIAPFLVAAEFLGHLTRAAQANHLTDIEGPEWDEVRVRRVLRLAARQGRVDEVAHDHFFLRSTVAEMVDIVRDVASQADGGQLTAAQFRDRVANGRKVAIDFFSSEDTPVTIGLVIDASGSMRRKAGEVTAAAANPISTYPACAIDE